MKILLDTSTLLSPKSGVGHYTDKISSSLYKSEQFDPFFYFENYFTKNLSEIKIRKKNLVQKILSKNIKFKYQFSSFKIRNFIKKNNIYVFHQPNFITYNLGIKNISTIHDLSWIHYPDFFLKNELRFFELYFEKSLKYSTKVIVHSNFIKKQLHTTFNFPEDLIEVIYEDIRVHLKCLNEIECSKFLDKFKLKYKNFFLILNTIEYRKNFKFILNIYQKLDPKIQEKFPLIIFGMKGRYSDKILNEINNVKNCKYYGYLDENFFNQCLSSAKILFYPSVYEGFGISPLESMASGTPVVASKIDVTREILKDNALLSNLDDEKEWIDNIMKLIDDEDTYNKIVQKGIYHSNYFKKGNTVNKILDVYKNI